MVYPELQIMSWVINILAAAAWLVNIKNRKKAMIIFTVTTLLAIIYFYTTRQVPFLCEACSI